MALGIDRAIAIYIADNLNDELPGAYPLQTGAIDPAAAVVYTGLLPPVPRDASAAAFHALTIAILHGGGPGPDGLLRERHTVSATVRHASSEVADETLRAVYALLHENGAGGNGGRFGSQGIFSGIRVSRITADSQPIRLGRDPSESGGRYSVIQAFTVQTVGGFAFA